MFKTILIVAATAILTGRVVYPPIPPTTGHRE